MTARLIPMTTKETALAEARAALRRPDRRSAAELRAACARLAAEGDWIDQELARLLRARLEEELFEEAARRAGEAGCRPEDWPAAGAGRRALLGAVAGAAVGAAALFVLFGAGLWLLAGLGWLP
jgi:hypothetical protein